MDFALHTFVLPNGWRLIPKGPLRGLPRNLPAVFVAGVLERGTVLIDIKMSFRIQS